ncbi:MAG: hypothetical protein IKM65_05565 [Bacteroidaceae bacterium]|nr:hypothetical protein [Bacteroidaceae bacterium]
MKKKEYEAPTLSCIELSTVEMITTSRIPVGGDTGRFDAPLRGGWDIWGDTKSKNIFR